MEKNENVVLATQLPHLSVGFVTLSLLITVLVVKRFPP
jgi:hypothetical protein